MPRHQKSQLLLALAQRKGHVGLVAEDLGLTLNMLRSELKSHNLDPDNLPGIREVKEAYTRCYLEKLMEGTGGNVSQAATFAGISQPAMSDYLKRYGVRADDFKSSGVREKLEQHRRAARKNWNQARRLE